MYKIPKIDIPIMSEDIFSSKKQLKFGLSMQPGIGAFNPKGVSRLSVTRPKSNLISYPLPGISRILLISTLFHDTQEISVELIFCGGEYGKDVYHLIGNINTDYGFTHLNYAANPKAENLNCLALVRAVMFNGDVEKYEGPRYEEVKNDKFWLKFIKETIEMAMIALVQNS